MSHGLLDFNSASLRQRRRHTSLSEARFVLPLNGLLCRLPYPTVPCPTDIVSPRSAALVILWGTGGLAEPDLSSLYGAFRILHPVEERQ